MATTALHFIEPTLERRFDYGAEIVGSPSALQDSSLETYMRFPDSQAALWGDLETYTGPRDGATVQITFTSKLLNGENIGEELNVELWGGSSAYLLVVFSTEADPSGYEVSAPLPGSGDVFSVSYTLTGADMAYNGTTFAEVLAMLSGDYGAPRAYISPNLFADGGVAGQDTYHYEFAVTVTVGEPYRRIFPRDDGLAGGSPRTYPPSRGVQSSNRIVGGYL